MINPVFQLACKILREYKKKYFIIGIAIILTAVLFTTVISITVQVYQAEEISKQLAAGSDFHASISQISIDQVDKITSHSLVKEVFFASMEADIYTNASMSESNAPALIACENSEILSHLFVEIIQGHYPQNEKEILLDKDFLNQLDSQATIGSEIILYIEQDGIVAPQKFILGGIFERNVDKSAKKVAFTNEPNENDLTAYLMFSNNINIEGKVNRLMSDLNLNSMTDINGAYFLSGSEIFSMETIGVIIFAVLIVFFCGFLLIYNIYSIMLTQDIGFYGLLKTIGTTGKQLMHLVSTQVSVLYAFSIPIGLLAGCFIGWRVLSPIFMSLQGVIYHYEFHPFIIIFTVITTYLTAFFSAILPVKKIKNISCLEAMRKEYKIHMKAGIKHSHNGAKPWRLALSNLYRNPKRTTIMIVSIVLSITLFQFSYIAVKLMAAVMNIQNAEFCIFDANEKITYNTIMGYSIYDYEPAVEDQPYYTNHDKKLSENMIEMIKQMDGVIKVVPIYTTTRSAAIKEMAANYITKQNGNEKDLDTLNRIRNLTLVRDRIEAYVYGIPEEGLEYLEDSILSESALNELKNTFDRDRFSKSGYALVNSMAFSEASGQYLSYYLPGEELSLDFFKKKYQVMAIAKYGRAPIRKLTSFDAYPIVSLDIYLSYEDFMQEFDEYDIMAINVFTDDGYEDSVKEQLESMSLGPTVVVRDKREQLTEYEKRIVSIQIVCYSLSFIVFLIGILNYLNTMICSINERRKDMALLQIVGMTNTQLKSMLLWENIYYIGFTILFSNLISLPLLMFIFKKAFQAKITINAYPVIGMSVALIIIAAITLITVSRRIQKKRPIERLRFG
jgi:putative ABC transport system permease protein